MRWDEVAELEPELDAGLGLILSAVAPNGQYKYSEYEFNQAYGDQYDFTVSFGASRPYRQMELVAGGASQKLSYRTRHEYVRLVKRAHLAKYTTQIRAIRKGLLQYLPADVMPLWNGYDLELAVAGEPDVPVEKLKREADVSLSSTQKLWFWECVDGMTPLQRCKLLRFATGRSRLPVGHFRVREEPRSRGDGALPQAATCAFTMSVPSYSSQEIMLRQLIIAIETEDFGTG